MRDEKALALKHIDAEIAKELCFTEENKIRVVSVGIPSRVMSLEDIKREIEDESSIGIEQARYWCPTPEDLERWRNEARIRLSKTRL